jgi:phasin family protein
MAKQNASQNGAFQNGSFDVGTIVETQRKNIEALTQVNQVAIGGAQKVLSRQIEIARQTLDDCSAMFRDLLQPNAAPQSLVVKQAALAKQTIENGLTSFRELAETATLTNTEALDIIGKRVTETLEEFGGVAKQLSANE